MTDPAARGREENWKQFDGPNKMNAAAFLVALRRRARAVSPARDPLADARRFLDAHGETAEGQGLRNVVETLASGAGVQAESAHIAGRMCLPWIT